MKLIRLMDFTCIFNQKIHVYKAKKHFVKLCNGKLEVCVLYLRSTAKVTTIWLRVSHQEY